MTNRQLLIDFATFQWEKLPEEMKLDLVGTVFNMRTIDAFLSQQEGKEPEKPREFCKCGSEMDIIESKTAMNEPSGRWITFKCPNCEMKRECLIV